VEVADKDRSLYYVGLRKRWDDKGRKEWVVGILKGSREGWEG
jgi:hypothetical protein